MLADALLRALTKSSAEAVDVKLLADELQVSERDVEGALAELEEKGYMRKRKISHAALRALSGGVKTLGSLKLSVDGVIAEVKVLKSKVVETEKSSAHEELNKIEKKLLQLRKILCGPAGTARICYVRAALRSLRDQYVDFLREHGLSELPEAAGRIGAELRSKADLARSIHDLCNSLEQARKLIDKTVK